MKKSVFQLLSIAFLLSGMILGMRTNWAILAFVSDTTAVYLPLITRQNPPEPINNISTQLIAAGFDKPLGLTHAGDERLFVIEQDGQIKIISNGAVLANPFLNITSIVNSDRSEQGLLGLAFHPDYAENGRFFINYINADGDTIIAEYAVSDTDANIANSSSEQILMTIEQPYTNHNGGHLAFGPDGYLYIGLGDGGSGNDPLNHGQNSNTLLGSILRIDIDGAAPYAIPANNPFVGDANGRDEIWSFGWRNPWKFSFDRQTGDMFIGDVGQNSIEEISFQSKASAGGENFGWRIFEGSECNIGDCNTPGLVSPIAEYSHSNGNCSVTGGYMYRGEAHLTLTGNYFFGDYCSGKIWRLFPNNDGSWDMTEVFQTGLLISSFGEDNNGELYFTDRVDGAVYQLTP